MSPRGTAAAVALAAFVLSAATAAPTVGFGDAGELVAAAWELGVAHPPGYPLYTLAARAALAVPVGEPAWRTNLLSGLAGAVAAGLVAWVVARETASAAAGIAAGGTLAVAEDVWAVATTTEVYTLHLAFVAALLAVASRYASTEPAANRRRVLLAGGVVLGLALAHRPTILLALPAVLVLGGAPGRAAASGGARSRGTARAWLAAGAVAVVLAAALYASLLARPEGAVVHWGAPDDLGSLWSHVTTRMYGHYRLGPAGWLRADAWDRLGGVLARGLGPAGAALAVVGAAGVVRGLAARARRLVAAGALLAAATAGFGLSYGTPDAEVLLLPAVLAAALVVGGGVVAVAGAAGRHGRRVGVLLAVAAVLAPVPGRLGRLDRSADTAAAAYGRDMLATVPADGVLFVQGDDAFLLAYLQAVLGERPDVRVHDRTGALYPDRLRSVHDVPPGEREVAFLLRAAAERPARPLLFMSWPGYELPPGLRWEPFGLFYRVARAGEPPADPSRVWAGYRAERIAAEARRTGDGVARTVAATYPLMRGARALWEGRRADAVSAFEQASALAGPSESIHNELGAIWARAGELDRAEVEFARAAAALPTSLRAWNNLARARWLRGDAAGAREAWRRSLALEPGQAEAREGLARSAP